MGMYNEIFAPCPICNGYAEIHISQVVLGFGEFYVDRPETIAQLSFEEKKELKDKVEERVFFCDTHGPFEVIIEIADKRPTFMW